MGITDKDQYFMQQALLLADRAERHGEVPVGAVVVRNDEIIGQGWNQPISSNDPTAHAEVMALRDAGKNLENYRLPETTLYVTLEPCPMCAGAIVHARVKRVVFAARDPRTGAAGSVFDLLPPDGRFNHHTEVDSGVMSEEASVMLSNFFKKRRQQKLQEKQSESKL